MRLVSVGALAPPSPCGNPLTSLFCARAPPSEACRDLLRGAAFQGARRNEAAIYALRRCGYLTIKSLPWAAPNVPGWYEGLRKAHALFKRPEKRAT